MEILRRRKPMFMDKPIAASLAEVIAIYTIADAHRVPVFSSSSLRWLPGCVRAKSGDVPGGTVVGANITSPCPFETQFRPEPDLYHCRPAQHTHVLRLQQKHSCTSRYTQSHAKAYIIVHTRICVHTDGVHGIEMLYTCLGTGCQAVSRTCFEDVDVCVGTWHDGRIG